ncbi:MAG: hypothetical protein ACUZ8I_16840 [Candidatus Scalindua sp.]
MSYKSVDGDPYFLFGVNADICAWISEIDAEDRDYHQHFIDESLFRKYPDFLVTFVKVDGNQDDRGVEGGELTLNDYVLALGKRNPYERRQKCIDIIRKLWASYPGLGPYPLLYELINFENNQVFYSKYRDHAAHQLMNYLLGLYIYYHCKPIHQKVNKEIRASLDGLDGKQVEDEFILRWFVASIVHDIGYVLEDRKADPSKNEEGETGKLWKIVEEGINVLLQNCLSQTPVFTPKGLGNDTKINEALTATGLFKFILPQNISRPERIGLVKDEDWLEKLDSGLKASGITDTSKSPLRTYYDLAHKNTPKGQSRDGFWDHGITSAMILLRTWYSYQDKVHAILKYVTPKEESDFKILKLSNCTEIFNSLSKYQSGEFIDNQLPNEKSILAAAEAISLHNINKDIWDNQSEDFKNHDFMKSNFSISFNTDDTTHKPKPLAFLLALVDTLQNWHRPHFKLYIDQKRSTSLIDKDLSITFDNGRNSEKIRLYYQKDGGYEKVKGVLKAFLDNEAIETLLLKNEGMERNFMIDPSFGDIILRAEELDEKTNVMLEDILTEENIKRIETLVGYHIDPKAVKGRSFYNKCSKDTPFCELSLASLRTITEYLRCSLALRDTIKVKILLDRMQKHAIIICGKLLKGKTCPREVLINLRNTLNSSKKLGSGPDKEFPACNIFDTAAGKCFLRAFLELRIANKSRVNKFFERHEIVDEIFKLPDDKIFPKLQEDPDGFKDFKTDLCAITIDLQSVIDSRLIDTQMALKDSFRVSKAKAVNVKTTNHFNKANREFPHLTKGDHLRIWRD